MTLEQALDQFRAAQTLKEVNAIAKECKALLAQLEADPLCQARALHLRNMAAYRRSAIQRGFV